MSKLRGLALLRCDNVWYIGQVIRQYYSILHEVNKNVEEVKSVT